MKSNNRLLKKNQLSTLIGKFTNSSVVQEMERNLNLGKSSLLLVNDIDDNFVIKSAPIKDKTLDSIYKSINKGNINPLIVRPKKDYYEIIYGRKRLLACKKYKISTIPALVINVEDEDMLLMLLKDNLEQRESNIIERALILKELADKYSYNQSSLAELTFLSRSQITNTLRMLTMPKHIIDDISLDKLSYGHAKAIASLSEDNIEKIVERIYKEKLSVRKTEEIAREYHKKQTRKIETLLNKYQCLIQEKDNNVTITFLNDGDKVKFISDIKSSKT